MSKEGHHLLLSLETSGKEEDAQWDVRMDWETVQRYCFQKNGGTCKRSLKCA